MALLTKSKYLKGIRCQLYLWRANKKLEPEPSLSDKQKFAQGYEFENYVKKLFPSGVDLSGLDFKENLSETKKLLSEKKLIFEAGIQVDDLFIRADLLEPVDGSWNLYEIKSSSAAKKEHIPDLAYQKYVCEKAGLKINSCSVLHLNKEYIRKGDIDVQGLVQLTNVTDKVNALVIDDSEIDSFLKTMSSSKEPPITISRACNNPHPCPFKEQCWGTLPSNNVMQLTQWRIYWELFNSGIVDLKDVPPETKLNSKDLNIMEAALSDSPVIHKSTIKMFLDSLTYPLYHFDFETFDTAVPLFDNCRPYQKMPFQYSLHIQEKDGSVSSHTDFLSTGGDPRVSLLKQMKSDLAGSGDIIVFNKSFEMMVLRQLAEDFPAEKSWIDLLLLRIVDLADVFKTFDYCHPSQKGKYSIKKVLPAVTGKSYSSLEIGNGGDASMLYFMSHISGELSADKEKIRKDLLEYCGLDTEGMVWIIDELKKMV